METTEIDAVITWVDGQDPRILKKRQSAMNQLIKADSENSDATRFDSSFEINFCVLSILKFAPFVRKIHIVTDEQTPNIKQDILNHFPGDYSKINIVDHKDIFKDIPENLPTFNSRSIETNLIYIPGLADHFITLNDDFIFIKPTTEKDFFKGNQPLLRGQWKISSEYRNWWNSIRGYYFKLLKKPFEARASYNLGQWEAAKILGYKTKFWYNDHSPRAINKRTLLDFFNRNKGLRKKNSSYAFRSSEQFLPISLHDHLEIKINNNKNRIHEKEVYIKPNKRKNYISKKLEYLRSSNCKELFLCIQSLDKASLIDREKIYEYLDQTIAKVDRNGNG